MNPRTKPDRSNGREQPELEVVQDTSQERHAANDALRLSLKYVSLDTLKPARRNARRHSAHQIRQLAASIDKFGAIAPLIVDADNRVVAGHGRLEALKLLGYRAGPVISVPHLRPEDVRLYALADNKIADNAAWDDGLLRIEISELRALDLDLSIAGFEAAEIDRLTIESDFSLETEPAAPPPPSAPVTRLGDLWQLGAHRIICTDMRAEGALETLLGSARAQASFSDPPYNVPVAGHVQVNGAHRHEEFQMASGEMSPAEYEAFLTAACKRIAEVSGEGSLHFICQDWRSLTQMSAAGAAAFTEHKALIVWDKTNAGMGSLYRSRHELIFLYKKGKAAHTNNIRLGRHGRNRANVWTYPGANAFGKGRDAALAAHPTVKPLALVADAILDVTRPGDIVLDTFAGSGTTILAAEKTGRCARAVEIDPGYVDVAIRRWQEMTGKCARLEGADLDFATVAAQRAGERTP